MGVIKKGGITFAGVSTLQELQDVTIDTLTLSNGQILKYNALNDKWENKDGSIQLSELTDVDFPEPPTDGQMLKYDGTSQKWINGTVSSVADLDDLTDVDFTTAPVDGDTLVYDETNDVWVPGASGGGGLEVVELTQAEYDQLTPEQKNNGKMYLINDAGKVLKGTLEAGSTSITFNDAAIKSNSMITPYTTIAGVDAIAATSSSGTLTLYYNSQATDMGVKVVIM